MSEIHAFKNWGCQKSLRRSKLVLILFIHFFANEFHDF